MEVSERQALVIDFERRLGADVIRREPGIPSFQELEHRASLILEEVLELCAALGVIVEMCRDEHGRLTLKYQARQPPNFAETVDALRDLEYVMYGLEVTLGVQAASDATFQEVHRANLAKLESGVVKDGKPVKPDGWQPPNLRRILQRMFPKQALLFR